MFALFFFLKLYLLPISTLFPYTTLFRSTWQDVVRQEFTEQSWNPLDMAVLTTLGAMDRLAPILTQVRHDCAGREFIDRKSTRLNSSHGYISYAVFCLKKKILMI